MGRVSQVSVLSVKHWKELNPWFMDAAEGTGLNETGGLCESTRFEGGYIAGIRHSSRQRGPSYQW